jgi:hypothetical protein
VGNETKHADFRLRRRAEFDRAAAESVTRTVKLNVPVVVNVPIITAPGEIISQVYGGEPPLTAKVSVYTATVSSKSGKPNLRRSLHLNGCVLFRRCQLFSHR